MGNDYMLKCLIANYERAQVERFFDLGQVATLLGGYLDVIGGMLEFFMLFCITGAGHFSAKAERKRTQRSFNDGRDICDWGNN